MNQPEYKVYLPLVMNEPAHQDEETHKLYLPLILDEKPDTTIFDVEQVRLWSAKENGTPTLSRTS